MRTLLNHKTPLKPYLPLMREEPEHKVQRIINDKVVVCDGDVGMAKREKGM